MTIQTAADAAIVDTNVLVAAVDRSRRHHAAALALFDGDTPLAVTPQILREFVVVATRPLHVNGLAMTAVDAAANASQFATRARILAEDHRTVLGLHRLLEQGYAVGKQVHDANVVACALAHGVREVITDNVRHFARFADLIEIVPLA